MALMRRLFTSKVTQESEKIVIVGIDFGTSFTKVYFNQGGDIKQHSLQYCPRRACHSGISTSHFPHNQPKPNYFAK